MNSVHSAHMQQQLIQEMYLDHHDWLQQWLRRRVAYPFSASDLVQDTFVRLLQSQHSLTGIQEPRAYLVNMAKNLLIDRQRRYRLEKNYLDSLAHQALQDEAVLEPQQLDALIDFLDFLTQALQRASPIARQAFLMYYFEGYKQSEIASKIGMSLRSTQLYLAQCLKLCYAQAQLRKT